MQILGEAKRLAQQYRAVTGKPLGITGEVAEYEAARILGVELTPARQAGYDALEHRNGKTRRLQIKGRCLLTQLQTRTALRIHRRGEGLGRSPYGSSGRKLRRYRNL